jgi:hypothetical protein
MRDTFVVRDQNGRKDMIPSQRERPMAMGDGTFMADNAFRESVPMMSYTPEELGINMAAYPTAPKEETAFELAMRDNSQSGDMPTMTPIEEVTLQQGTSPFFNVVKEDEYDGGVQFNAPRMQENNLIQHHAYDILRGLVLIGVGIYVGKNWF